MRRNITSAILNDQANHKVVGKRGPKPRRNDLGDSNDGTGNGRTRRASVIPDYEEIADWRGIEGLLHDSQEEEASRPEYLRPEHIARSLEIGRKRKGPADGDGSGRVSAFDLLVDPHQGYTPGFADLLIAGSMHEAISSARISLQPHLKQMAEDTRRSAGGKTMSLKTLGQYRQLADMLLRQFMADLQIPMTEFIPWQNFAEWLLSRQYDVKPATWRLYRSAMIEYMRGQPSGHAEQAICALLAEGETWEDGGKSRNADEDARTLREKRIVPDDFDRILWYCRRNSGSLGSLLLETYLRANIRVGLRPVEFLSSVVKVIPDDRAPLGRQAWLFTCNAKFSGGRTNGPIRSIDMSAMSHDGVEIVMECIQQARMQSKFEGYDVWLKSINRALFNIGNSKSAGLSTRYTAYSARHQAIANWKATYDPIAVAALAGHAMPSTAETHYAKARDAWPEERLEGMLVRPGGAAVDRVRRRVMMAKQLKDRRTGGAVPRMEFY